MVEKPDSLNRKQEQRHAEVRWQDLPCVWFLGGAVWLLLTILGLHLTRGFSPPYDPATTIVLMAAPLVASAVLAGLLLPGMILPATWPLVLGGGLLSTAWVALTYQMLGTDETMDYPVDPESYLYVLAAVLLGVVAIAAMTRCRNRRMGFLLVTLTVLGCSYTCVTAHIRQVTEQAQTSFPADYERFLRENVLHSGGPISWDRPTVRWSSRNYYARLTGHCGTMTLLMYVHVPEREDRDIPPVLKAFWDSWPLERAGTPAEMAARGALHSALAKRLVPVSGNRNHYEAEYDGFHVSCIVSGRNATLHLRRVPG